MIMTFHPASETTVGSIFFVKKPKNCKTTRSGRHIQTSGNTLRAASRTFPPQGTLPVNGFPPWRGALDCFPPQALPCDALPRGERTESRNRLRQHRASCVS